MRIAVLANDVIPGMGLPVAAPGLRAWGMALGLREKGHEVTVVVDQWMARWVWSRRIVPPVPHGAVVLSPGRLAAWVVAQRIDALVITNSNAIDHIGDLGRCRIVYDFFAPKMLELAENVDRVDRDDALDKLEQRKLRALGRSDLVTVNGAKKLPYVREWLDRAGVADQPCVVVNPGLPPVAPDPAPTERLQLIVSGYIQPWSRPGAWVDAVLPLLDEGLVDLNLVVGKHWAPQSREAAASEQVERLADHPRVRRHPLLGFPDFRALQSRCHLSLDVFVRNPERELAMVTRSVVALSCGLPVMHVDFTEVSPWISEHNAGWLVDEQDATGIETILRSVADDRSVLDAKRAGAVKIAETVLRPDRAVEPLDEVLEAAR